MARKYNKLTHANNFRLCVALQQHCSTSGHATFANYGDAAAFFSKALSLEVSAKNVEGAVGVTAVTGLLTPRKNGDTLTPMWRTIRDAEARIKLLESRLAEIETIVKS